MLRRLAAIPADQAVVRRALRLATDLTQEVTGGADAVTISLAPLGRLREVVTARDDIAVLDHDQYALGEGPCLQAAEGGLQVHVGAATSEERWRRSSNTSHQTSRPLRDVAADVIASAALGRRPSEGGPDGSG